MGKRYLKITEWVNEQCTSPRIEAKCNCHWIGVKHVFQCPTGEESQWKPCVAKCGIVRTLKTSGCDSSYWWFLAGAQIHPAAADGSRSGSWLTPTTYWAAVIYLFFLYIYFFTSFNWIIICKHFFLNCFVKKMAPSVKTVRHHFILFYDNDDKDLNKLKFGYLPLYHVRF